MSLISKFSTFDMNSSLNSSNSDEFIDELNWTTEFATPGKCDGSRESILNMSIDSPAISTPRTPPSSFSKDRTSLKLFETPSTPCTIVRRSSQSENISPTTKNSHGSGIKAHYQITRRSGRINALKRATNTPSPLSPIGIANPFQTSTPCMDEPKSRLSSESKRRKLKHDHENLNDIKVSLFDLRQPVRPIHRPLRQTRMMLDHNQSRYRNEFKQIALIGKGQFGEVYKCENRVDTCLYALKRLIKPIAGSLKETAALREVQAHALLGKHQHILQYYSAWAEDKHMIIQNEYCNGGSLTDTMNTYRANGQNLPENDLKQILAQVSKGLKYMHSIGLVHLDIKPGNIFISHNEVEDDERKQGTCYKIGDLGMATKISDPTVEDGDVRYLPKELIDDDYSDLTKADVFSLSLTVYEVASLVPLPLNGPEWHRIRDGTFDPVSTISKPFMELLTKMISPEHSDRPRPAVILQDKVLITKEREKICNLTRQLNEERMENQRLLRELAKKKDSPLMSLASNRLVGGKGQALNRSMSIA